MEECNLSNNSDHTVWNIFGYNVPKQEVVYFSQILALYLVIFVCLINLSIGNDRNDIWISLLSASVGYLLPNPSLKQRKIILQRNII